MLSPKSESTHHLQTHVSFVPLSHSFVIEHTSKPRPDPFPTRPNSRWDRLPTDITSYPELEQIVIENKGRLNSAKAKQHAGGQ